MKTKYRVVSDRYAGFEVQKKLWWYPFWIEPQYEKKLPCNTFVSLEKAIEWINQGCPKKGVTFKIYYEK